MTNMSPQVSLQNTHVPVGKLDGRKLAIAKKLRVVQQATHWKQQHLRPVTIASLFPYEDDASVIYTKLKQKDAQEVEIAYQTKPISLRLSAQEWRRELQKLIDDRSVDGILIQKPSRTVYTEVTGNDKQAFVSWWSSLVEHIPVEKDVDGLSPMSLMELAIAGDRVMRGKRDAWDDLSDWVLPATAQAAVDILLEAHNGSIELLRQQSVAVIGQSVIVGKPLVYGLKMLGVPVTMLRSKDSLEQELPKHSVIVSATGVKNLVQAEWIQPESVLVDVGAPKPEFAPECYEVARLWTPVPYGVGPVTRACLLENALKLI